MSQLLWKAKPAHETVNERRFNLSGREHLPHNTALPQLVHLNLKALPHAARNAEGIIRIPRPPVERGDKHRALCACERYRRPSHEAAGVVRVRRFTLYLDIRLHARLVANDANRKRAGCLLRPWVR